MLLTQAIAIPFMSMTLAASWSCPVTQASYSLTPKIYGTKYIRTKSAADLRAMHGHGSPAAVGGLGGGEVGYKIQVGVYISKRGDEACVALDDVDVTFYAKPTIHIASNFRRASCEYGAIIAHEKKHVRTLRNFHREYTPKFRREIAKIVKTIRTKGPMPVSGAEQAQNAINQQIEQKISAYLRKIMQDLEKKQDAIDTPAEYERVSKQCKNWDKKFYGND